MSRQSTIKLHKEEKELDKAIAAGEYVSVKHLSKEKEKYQNAARDTFAKIKR